MKKIVYFLLILCCFFCIDYGNKIFAENGNVFYGRAISSGIYIYSSPEITVDKSNKIFEIPVTYFVMLVGEENDLFYKARYNDINGYVLKNEVSCIDQTPITPFVTNASFRVFTPSGANLRSSPNESKGATNLITTIAFMDTNLVFYGNCEGEEAISYKGNNWYYCKYIKPNQEYYGYVYSPLCDLLSTIPQNTEEYTYVTPNFTEVNNEINNEDNYLSITTPWQIIIIVLVSLPCIFIIYFLFKPTKIAMQKNTSSPRAKHKQKKKISKLKHSDYYELDSDYFN